MNTPNEEDEELVDNDSTKEQFSSYQDWLLRDTFDLDSPLGLTEEDLDLLDKLLDEEY